MADPYSTQALPGPALALRERTRRDFRADRMRLFLQLVAGRPRPLSILDVGGTGEFWKRYRNGFDLTLLNRFEQPAPNGVKCLVGDACDLSRFADGAFDVVFSNSTIGHVGGWEQQQRMAREIRRVGRGYWLQTPAQWFPLDWRTETPFFHWLPDRLQASLLMLSPIGSYPRCADYCAAMTAASRVRNLSGRELRALFPDGTIVPERAAGLVKSFVVHHGLISQ
jgi:hypothetical protein